MDAANASLHKYYVDDLSDLIDCMDYGLHQSLARAVLARSDAIKQVSTPLVMLWLVTLLAKHELNVKCFLFH